MLSGVAGSLAEPSFLKLVAPSPERVSHRTDDAQMWPHSRPSADEIFRARHWSREAGEDVRGLCIKAT